MFVFLSLWEVGMDELANISAKENPKLMDGLDDAATSI